MNRALDAASRTFITRDESGKRRLDTSYILRTLTSVAAHAAYRPYWARSTSEPFSDFGSTVGNDAGMNLLHEFSPGLRHLMAAHMPKFVARIEGRITGEPRPLNFGASTPSSDAGNSYNSKQEPAE